MIMSLTYSLNVIDNTGNTIRLGLLISPRKGKTILEMQGDRHKKYFNNFREAVIYIKKNHPEIIIDMA